MRPEDIGKEVARRFSGVAAAGAISSRAQLRSKLVDLAAELFEAHGIDPSSN